MGRYLIGWNWLAIAALMVNVFMHPPSPLGTIVALCPFAAALASAAWIESPLVALVVRLLSGLYALLIFFLLLYISRFAPASGSGLGILWIVGLCIVVPALNAFYLEPYRPAPPPRRVPRPLPTRPQPPEA